MTMLSAHKVSQSYVEDILNLHKVVYRHSFYEVVYNGWFISPNRDRILIYKVVQ